MAEKKPKDYRGLRIFGIRVVWEKKFRRLVAAQCYGLTHELVTNKLHAGFMDGRESRYTNSAWLELDRAMKEFTDSVT